jgi:hypothetical protein
MGEVNERVEIDISKIIQQYNFYYEHIIDKCQQCYVNKFCGVCLFQMKNSNIDKLDKKEFICENFHDKISFEHKLNRIFSFLEKSPNDYLQILENVIVE